MATNPDNQQSRHLVKSFDEDLASLTNRIAHMGGVVEQQVFQAIESLVQRDADLAAKVVENDATVDKMEEEVDQHAIRLLATRQPMAIDLRMITMALKISNDLERMSDYASGIAKRAQRLSSIPAMKPMVTIPYMGEMCQGMIKDVLDAYIERDTEKAMGVWKRDVEVDNAYNSLFRELLTYMIEDPRTITTCIDLLFVAKNIERIGDHATNIAEKIDYIMHGDEINRSRDTEAE